MSSKTRTAVVSTIALGAVLATGAFAGVPAPAQAAPAKASASQAAPISGAVSIVGSNSPGSTVNAVLSGPAATIAKKSGASVNYQWTTSKGETLLPSSSAFLGRNLSNEYVSVVVRVSAPGYQSAAFSATIQVASQPSNLAIYQIGYQGSQRVFTAQPDVAGYPSGTSFRWDWYRNGQFVQSTGSPQLTVAASQPVGTEYRVVQVAVGPFAGEHRLDSANRARLVNVNQWVLY